MSKFNFERQEDVKEQSYASIDNSENKTEISNVVNEIPYRICSYGYLDPGKEVFDFLKDSALCELIDETAYVALSSYYDYCFYTEGKSRFFGLGSTKKVKRVLTERQMKMLDVHFYESKSVLRYRRGFQRIPLVKDDRLIKYDDEFFTKDSCALFPLPDYEEYETSCEGWAKKNILGNFAKVDNDSGVDTYFDFFSSGMMDSCKNGNYDFMKAFLYFQIMSSKLHTITEDGVVKHDVRNTAPMLNMILGSTPKYTFDEIRKIVGRMHNNQIFVNFILVGTNFSEKFLHDMKIICDNMPNARIAMYPEKFMLDDRRSFWNNEKMIKYLSDTPSFDLDIIQS